MTEALSETAVRAGMAGELDEWTITLFQTIDSTNSFAKRESKSAGHRPGVIVSDTQRAGRGRGTHSWESPAGVGLYLSVLNTPRIEKSRFPAINLAAGIAASEAIYRETRIEVSLKWPNDVLHEGKKLGGLLIESGYKNTLVTGIGLNINNDKSDFPEEIKDRATSLYLASGLKYNRNKIASSFINSFYEWSLTLERSPEKVVKAWKELSSTIGRRVTILKEGKREEGTAVDVDELGFLLIENGYGKRVKLTSGEICCWPSM